MNARRPRAAALSLAAFLALGGGAAQASVRITTDPGLKPSFELSTPDYVSRCDPGRPLRVSVSASEGDRVSVAGRPMRGGDFTADVSVATGTDVPVAVTSGGRKSNHHVRCLPRDFPRSTVRRDGRPQAQWYVITPAGPERRGYVAIFDARGVPMWWMHSAWYAPWDGKLLANGNVVWTRNFGDLIGLDPRQAWEERRLDGTLVRTLKTVGNTPDFHDLVLLPSGNYLLEAYPPRTGVDLRQYGGPKNAKVYDGEVQEVTPAGKLVWRWSSRGHVALSETRPSWWKHVTSAQNKKPPDKRAYDLVHVNSVEPDGGGFIVSMRFPDAVYRIDRKSGAVDWKLGGTKTPERLKVKNDPHGSHPFSGQHDARLYHDHTLTVFDNGTKAKRRPRVVRYRIDEARRTATLLEELTDADVPYSGCCGGTRKLPGGNWVTYWGGTTWVTEHTPSGKRVLSIRFRGDTNSYRAFPILRGRVTAQQLRLRMNVVAKSPEVPRR